MTFTTRFRFSHILALALLLSAPLFAQKKPVTLRDVFMNAAFQPPRMVNMQWMQDGRHYTYVKTDRESGSRSIMRVDARSGDEQVLVDIAGLALPNNAFDGYRWEDNERFMVITIEERPIWRRSTIGSYAVFDTQTKKLTLVPSHDSGVMNVKVSPDGNWVGYVYADNLWIMNIATGEETQLTSDAAPGVYNGRFGWVYEEEFSIVDGWQWSPDSKRIAFWQEDERAVPEFTMTNWMPLYQELIRIRYPKPGENNPVEKIGVIDIASKERRWMDIGSETDIYVPRIAWTRDVNTLCIYRMNRLQNVLELLFADVRSGTTRTVLTDRSSTGWIGVDDGHHLQFLKKSDHFLWLSESSGYNHLYLYDYSGKQIRQLTSGNWEVTEVTAVSADEKTVYYISTEVSPLERHLYSVSMKGGKSTRLTKDAGRHSINMSPGGELYVDTWSNISRATTRALFDDEGEQVRALGATDMNVFDSYAWSAKELLTITTSDGVTLDVSMIKPPDFDPTKKYPVFMDVYGGPGTQAVYNSWPGTMQQWYANEGFIVVQVDNRGSAGRGTAFKHAVYKQLGKWESHDYVETAKYLATLPFVDKDNIGIWGWSYGGYMSALSLMLGGGHFKAAVSIAPVTDWTLYDTIYAERFMQRPSDNPDGYKVGSCLEHADKLKGALLLIHGGLDDNVHVQNTMKLIDRLEEAGLQFDMRIYPNGDHGVAGGMKSRLGLFEYYMQHMKKHLKNG
ncbi:MAG TPA: S9 family peptidase [Bacteroidota bacterium]|nr:S9 family peptidase [Bacteroidota bacterium]